MNQEKTISLGWLEKECTETERAWKAQGAPGKPKFRMIFPEKPENDLQLKMEILPGLEVDVVLSGYHSTPCVVLIKCESVRKYLRKVRGESTMDDRTQDKVTQFFRRNHGYSKKSRNS
jgi:hypothetical protein